MYTYVAENRKLLHEQNVEKVLVELLSVADVGVKTATCQAVHIMSFHLASKDRFRDLGTYIHIHTTTLKITHSPQWSVNELDLCVSGGIPAVVQLLNNNSLVPREAATQALSNLTHNNQLNAL